MRHPHERPAGNVHRLEETVALNVDHPSVQRLLRGERDRVKQKIESAPLLLDALERLFHLSFSSHVERHEDRRLKLLRQRFDMFLCPVVQISDRQFRAKGPKRFRAPPSDRLIIGDADNETFSSLQRNLGFRKYWNAHDSLSR